MLDTPTSNNYRDFHARYHNTYGWILRPGRDKQFVKLLECDETELRFTLDDGMTHHVNVDSGVMFEFQQVERGFYRVNDDIWYLARVPARQWKRGICVANTQLMLLDKSGKRWWVPEDRGFDTFKVILTTPQNYACTGSKYKHKLLSKHFCVTSAGHVYFYQQQIGNELEGRIKLTESGQIVQQELRDVIKRNNWSNMYTVLDEVAE